MKIFVGVIDSTTVGNQHEQSSGGRRKHGVYKLNNKKFKTKCRAHVKACGKWQIPVGRNEFQRALKFRTGDLDLMQLIPGDPFKFLRRG